MATIYKPTRATLAEHLTQGWEFRDFPINSTIEHLLNPETWSHVSKHFKLGDEILVKPQGLPYRAHLIVVDAASSYAKLRLLDLVLLNAASAETAEVETVAVNGPMYVKWNLGTKKFAIHRSSDNEKVHDGFAIKAEAEEWAENHAMAMAA
jgi:hypothetical protein